MAKRLRTKFGTFIKKIETTVESAKELKIIQKKPRKKKK